MSEPTIIEIGARPNWESFYRVLQRLGPRALTGIPKEWVRWFQIEGATSDWFWSESQAECLFEYWDESPERAVEQALLRYVEAVQAGLAELPVRSWDDGWAAGPATGELMSWSDSIGQIGCVLHPRLVRALVNAAQV